LLCFDNQSFLKAWDPTNRTLVYSFKNVVNAFPLLNGNLFIHFSNNTALFLNMNDGSVIDKIENLPCNSGSMLILLNNGRLACISSTNSILIFDPSNLTSINTLASKSATLIKLISNTYLASVIQDFRIVIWDYVIGLREQTVTGFTCHINFMTYLYNGNIASSSVCNEIIIFNLRNVNLKNFFSINITYYGQITVQAGLKSGALACGFSNGTIIIWTQLNIWAQFQTKELTSHTDRVNAIIELENGYLATGSDDQTIIIWNIYDGLLPQIVFVLRYHTSAVTSLVLLNNKNMASGSADGSVKIHIMGPLSN